MTGIFCSSVINWESVTVSEFASNTTEPRLVGRRRLTVSSFWSLFTTVAWPSGNGDAHVNKVVLRPARLALGWVTLRGYTVLVCNQPTRPTQPPTLSRMGNEYRPRSSGTAVWLGR